MRGKRWAAVQQQGKFPGFSFLSRLLFLLLFTLFLLPSHPASKHCPPPQSMQALLRQPVALHQLPSLPSFKSQGTKKHVRSIRALGILKNSLSARGRILVSINEEVFFVFFFIFLHHGWWDDLHSKSISSIIGIHWTKISEKATRKTKQNWNLSSFALPPLTEAPAEMKKVLEPSSIFC